MLTVAVIVGAALLLIAVASLLRGMAQRRISPAAPALVESAPAQPPAAEPEISDDERKALERALRAGEAQ